MTPRGTARTLTTIAVLSALAGIAAIPCGALAVMLGLALAVICIGLAAGYRQRHYDDLHRHEQARRAAIAFPDPKPIPAPEQQHGPPLTAIESEAWKTITDHLKQEQQP